MTREEAITILKDISWQMGSVKRWENIEAIDMAIEALSAEAVSREFYEDAVKANHGLAKELCELKALAEAEWIPFTRRPMTKEEQEYYPNCTFIFDCVLPDDGDEILVSNGRFVWMDTFCKDIDGCYLDGSDDIDEDMAWMPLPEPYREDGE